MTYTYVTVNDFITLLKNSGNFIYTCVYINVCMYVFLVASSTEPPANENPIHVHVHFTFIQIVPAVIIFNDHHSQEVFTTYNVYVHICTHLYMHVHVHVHIFYIVIYLVYMYMIYNSLNMDKL